jgi:hypothetical protein
MCGFCFFLWLLGIEDIDNCSQEYMFLYEGEVLTAPHLKIGLVTTQIRGPCPGLLL